MKPTLGHRLEYAFYRAVSGVVGLLPQRWALGLGGAIGWVAGVVFRIRRADVDAHLLQAFPNRDRRWRALVARAAYTHLGREAIATLRLSRLGREGVRAQTTVDGSGWGPLQKAIEQGQGAVMVTGHLGNWELGGAALAVRGIPVDAVVFRQKNPLFDVEITETRQALGMETFTKQEAARAVMKGLRAGRAAALVADQNVREGGVFVDFFGRPAATAKGPALLALRTGAPVIFGAAVVQPPGSAARVRVTLEEIPFEPTGDLEADVARLTEAYTRTLEGWVERVPEQYFWMHRRWKTRPDGETA